MKISFSSSKKKKKSKVLFVRTPKKTVLESTCSSLDKAYPECSLTDKCCYLEIPSFPTDIDVEEDITELHAFKVGKKYRITIEEL